jgi:uncharacterized membrane protein YczE
MSFRAMVVDAARRFVILLLAIGGATALGGLVLGAAFGAAAWRSISVGFYAVGCFLLLAGFVLGNRGPLRVSGADTGAGFWGTKAVRRATLEEREDALASSVIFVVIGLVLVALGVVVDQRFRLV